MTKHYCCHAADPWKGYFAYDSPDACGQPARFQIKATLSNRILWVCALHYDEHARTSGEE